MPSNMWGPCPEVSTLRGRYCSELPLGWSLFLKIRRQGAVVLFLTPEPRAGRLHGDSQKTGSGSCAQAQWYFWTSERLCPKD